MSCANVVSFKRKTYFSVFLLFKIFTCVPKRTHHEQTEHEVDHEGSPHLTDRVVVPRPVLLNGVDPSVPVHVREGHVETLNDVEELVKVASHGSEFLRGEDLHETKSQELNRCQNKECNEGAPE